MAWPEKSPTRCCERHAPAGMTEPGKQREVWLVLGPLDPNNLPAGCGAARLQPDLIRRSLKVVELILRIGRLGEDR